MINAVFMLEKLAESFIASTPPSFLFPRKFPAFHSPRALYKLIPMINRADIAFANAAPSGALLRGLLILIRL
ncbi:hypothetical protein I5192_01245 [Ruegeria sp. SCSIO 43209]|uniref:hypothetical protein n=1 Tax=Ruegeria sp. SCSIO 43209 TaxID=2793010 RepID=UPI00147E7D7C|nr:hypothetical protein [Ruegeria sp. SCSIO 43209]UAB89343.1 hypothetical protein I5192_01245 [Ruegeria sp. SCSIO 43209]